MLKIKDSVDLKELEKFGFRPHKKDEEGVIVSKWKREWVESDSIDGYLCDSGGWEFYPVIEIFEDRSIKVYLETWGWQYTKELNILFDLIQAGYIEKVEE